MHIGWLPTQFSLIEHVARSTAVGHCLRCSDTGCCAWQAIDYWLQGDAYTGSLLSAIGHTQKLAHRRIVSQ